MSKIQVLVPGTQQNPTPVIPDRSRLSPEPERRTPPNSFGGRLSADWQASRTLYICNRIFGGIFEKRAGKPRGGCGRLGAKNRGSRGYRGFQS